MLKMLTEEEFQKRASGAGRVAVFREFLADRETPVAALSRLDDDEEAFLLESVAGGETRGRYSYLGLEPCGKIEGEETLQKLKTLFAEMHYAPAPELPPFQGGADVQIHQFVGPFQGIAAAEFDGVAHFLQAHEVNAFHHAAVLDV